MLQTPVKGVQDEYHLAWVQQGMLSPSHAFAHAFVQCGRDEGAVKGELDDYLVADSVIASSAQTMEDTLRYLDTRYGGIRKYLRCAI